MQVGNIELLAGCMWQHLVMLLQDLVETLHTKEGFPQVLLHSYSGKAHFSYFNQFGVAGQRWHALRIFGGREGMQRVHRMQMKFLGLAMLTR